MTTKYSPENYSKTLDNLKLHGLSFLEVQSKCYPEKWSSGSVDVDAHKAVKFELEPESNRFAAIEKYKFVGTIKSKEVFTINLRLAITMELNEKPSREFLTTFEKNTLRIFTYPYVRQIVHDLTMRMGIQPLVLPLWRVPDSKPKGTTKKRLK